MKSTKITLITLIVFFISIAGASAQIKIGKNPTTINPSSLLEVESDNKGVLLPRVALQSADNFAPLAAHVAGMIVYNTATAGTAPNNVVPGFYYNDGTHWLNLADLAVTNAKLAANAVTTDKILDGTILAADISTGAVTTAQILDGTIKNEDLNKTDIPLSGFAAAAASVDLGSQNLINVKDPINPQDAATKKYVDDATAAINTLENGKIYLGNASNVATEVAMSGDVTMDNAGVTTIGASKVLTGMIANGTIIAEDIAVGAVTTDQILDGTILVADLANNAVETAKIKDLNVTTDKLAADAVTTEKILNANVTTAKIADSAVTTEKIASGGNDKVLVTSSTGVVSWLDKTGFGAVADQTTIEGAGTDLSKFSVKNDGITTDKLADGAVTSAKIANGTIIAEDIAVGAVTTAQILDGTIKNEDLNKTDIPLSGFAAAAASVDLGSQNLINVKDPINLQDAATKKYVDDATAAINTLENGKIYLGNASNVATEVAMTGDVTISNTGVTTITNDAVTTTKILDANVTPAKIAPGTDKQILVTTGASPAAVEWFTPTNTLTATDGQLVSTVNGLATTPAVNVLISADNGLTVTDGNVQLGGALTAATIITTDATKTLALVGLVAGANTDKMLVVDANGVVKSVDASARNVLGIVKKTGDYTVVDSDHTILADVSGGDFTITLPTASSSTGRVLLIRKTDETNNELTFSESIQYSESTSFTTLNYLSTIRIQSDGTAWYKID